MFHPNRDNFHIFSTELLDKRNPPTGRIEIELIVETEQEPIIVLESENCFKSKETVITRDPITTYTNLTSLPMHLLPEKVAPGEGTEKVAPSEGTGMYYVSIFRFCIISYGVKSCEDYCAFNSHDFSFGKV